MSQNKKETPFCITHAPINGKKTRGTIPENNSSDWDETLAGLQQNFSPEAFAAIACYLDRANNLEDETVATEIRFFANALREKVGTTYTSLLNELGL